MVRQNNNQDIETIIPNLIQINIVITEKNCKPCLELRKVTTDTNLIKTILSSAFHNKPIIVQPTFIDKIKSLATLQEKGIIYFDKDKQQYLYTI